MSTSSATTTTSTRGVVPAWQQWVRWLYLGTAVLVGAAIVGQVFFAGAAVLVNPAYWAAHRGLGNTIEFLALALVLVGLGTRLSWRVQGLGGLLYVLMLLQYVFLYLMPQAGLPLLRALHAVNALALFGVTCVLGMQIWRQVRSRGYMGQERSITG